MTFTTGAALLDAVVLAVVSREGTYGYKITQDVRTIVDVSESTLYPVLRRLQKDNCLDTYDRENCRQKQTVLPHNGERYDTPRRLSQRMEKVPQKHRIGTFRRGIK